MEFISRFKVRRELGHGAMGSVLLAHDPRLDRQVAIKLLQAFDNQEACDRFFFEARAASRLGHPNIVTVYDAGEHDGRPFIAMEFVDGVTLAHVIRQRVDMNLPQRLALLEQLCAGLAFAHAAGLIHRDIKPSNLMIDASGNLKILDFGIAKTLGGMQTRPDNFVIGTLRYAAPERLEHGIAEPRGDQFSAGLVAYELLSLRPAFQGSPPELVSKIRTVTIEPLHVVAPHLDRNVCAIVARALSREPADRFPDMTTMGRELARARQRLEQLDVTITSRQVLDRDPTAARETVPIRSRAPTRQDENPTLMLLANERRESHRPEPDLAFRTFESEPSVARWPVRPAVVAATAATLLVVLWVVSPSEFGPRTPAAALDDVTGPQTATPAAAQPIGSDARASDGTAPPAGRGSATMGATSATDRKRATSSGPADRITGSADGLVRIRELGRLQRTAGQQESALATVVAGLSSYPSDRELVQLLRDLQEDARARANRARTAAIDADAPKLAPGLFDEAVETQRSADRLNLQGPSEESVRVMSSAAALFDRAVEVAEERRRTVSGPDAGAGSLAETSSGAPDSSGSPAASPPALDLAVVEAERRAIENLLQQYQAAFRSLSGAAVKALRPSLTPAEVQALDRQFVDAKTHQLEFSNVQITLLDVGQASVSCEATHIITPRVGSQRRITGPAAMRLRKVDEQWLIVAFRGPL